MKTLRALALTAVLYFFIPSRSENIRTTDLHTDRRKPKAQGKQLLDNVQWRQECAAKVGLGFTLPEEPNELLLDKSGQVFAAEIARAVSQ